MQSWHSALHILIREHPLWAGLLPVKYSCHQKLPVPITDSYALCCQGLCRLIMGPVSETFGKGGYGKKVGFVGELCTLQDYNTQNAMQTVMPRKRGVSRIK